MPDKKISEMPEESIGLAPGDFLTFLDIDEPTVDDINKKVTFAVLTAPFAPLASPSFTGIPTVPTPDTFDSSTQIANTEWVGEALLNLELVQLSDVDIPFFGPGSPNDGDVVKWDANSGFWIAGQAGGAVNRETLTANKQLLSTDATYQFLDSDEGVWEVFLPVPPVAAMRFEIKHIGSLIGSITVRESNGGTVIGPLDINTPIVECIYDGTEWHAKFF